MIDRRDFMKLFGVGCAVVPIIGGVPVGAAESKLIEVPKLTLVEAPSLAGPAELTGMSWNVGNKFNTTVIFEQENGKKIFLHGSSFVTRVDMGIEGIKSWHNVVPTQVVSRSSRSRLTYTLKGEFIQNENGELLTVIEEAE